MRTTSDAPSDGVDTKTSSNKETDGSRLSRWAMDVLAILIILLMISIVVQVVFSYIDFNPVASFDENLFLLGDAITLNTLLDMQWHLLVIVALTPAGLILLRNGHVRVDFIYATLPQRTQSAVDLVGHLIFAAPFLYFVIPAAISFMQSAHRSGQGSSNGGLNDLFVIKAVLPLGLMLIAAAVVIDILLLIRRLVRR